jgi:hypothetical protein
MSTARATSRSEWEVQARVRQMERREASESIESGTGTTDRQAARAVVEVGLSFGTTRRPSIPLSVSVESWK